MGITEEQIRDYAAELGKRVEPGTTVWAVCMTSAEEKYRYEASDMLLDLNYNLLCVEEQGILVIGVDGAGDLTPMHLWMENKEIQSLKIKKGVLAHEIILKTERGEMRYRMNKAMLGCAFQKENVPFVIEKLELKQELAVCTM